MKVNYKPSGPSWQNAPKQWEVWLADTPFGETGKKRCSVLVSKRTPAAYTVYEIIPVSLKGLKDVILSDPFRAGQEKPSAVRLSRTAEIQMSAFIQKLGTVPETDVNKIILARQ